MKKIIPLSALFLVVMIGTSFLDDAINAKPEEDLSMLERQACVAFIHCEKHHIK